MGNRMGFDKRGRMAIMLMLPVPPSDNKLYWTQLVRAGKKLIPIRVPTDEAKAWKRSVQDKVAELAVHSSQSFLPNVPYDCIITLFFPVENKTWPKMKSRFRRLDVQNRGKLAIDAVMQSIGIDDHHLFGALFRKRNSEKEELRITVRERRARGQRKSVL